MGRYCTLCGDYDCCEPNCPDHKIRCGCGDYANCCGCNHSPEQLAEIIARNTRTRLYVASYPIHYMPPGQPLAIVHWNEADADPLADIAKWREAFKFDCFKPQYITMAKKWWRKVYQTVYRKKHGKRAWRRHRGALKQKGIW